MTELRAMMIGPFIGERHIAVVVEKYSRKVLKLIVPISISVISGVLCTQQEFFVESLARESRHFDAPI
jgi:hypothetical protein